jgi:hypothetical protein
MTTIKEIIRKDFSPEFRTKLFNEIGKAYTTAYLNNFNHPNFVAKNHIGNERQKEVETAFFTLAGEYPELSVFIRKVEKGGWQYTEVQSENMFITISHVSKYRDFFSIERQYMLKKAKNNPHCFLTFEDFDKSGSYIGKKQLENGKKIFGIITHGNGSFSPDHPNFVKFSIPDKSLKNFIYQEDLLIISEEQEKQQTKTKPVLKKDVYQKDIEPIGGYIYQDDLSNNLEEQEKQQTKNKPVLKKEVYQKDIEPNSD